MKTNRLAEIDLFRFVAALSVVLFHYTFRGNAADGLSPLSFPLLAPITKYGHYGVELFFMISGFVILMTAARGDLRSFFVSRVVRLYPAFWFCCTLTAIAIVVFHSPLFSVGLKQYLLNLTMLSELFNARPVDGVYWTLLVEIKFYCLVALLLLFRKIQYTEIMMVIWLLYSLVVEFFHPQFFTRFSLTGTSSFFIAGTFFYYLWAHGFTKTRLVILIIIWAVSIYRSVTGLGSFETHYNTVMNPFIVAAIISLFFVTMFLTATNRMGFLGRKNWMALGVITYPLYLIHQNIGYLIFTRFDSALDPALMLVLVTLAVVGLAYAIHLYIEKPLASWLKVKVNGVMDYCSLRFLPTKKSVG